MKATIHFKYFKFSIAFMILYPSLSVTFYLPAFSNDFTSIDSSFSLIQGSKKGIPYKNVDRPQTLAEQAKLAEPEQDDLPSPGATAAAAAPKMSKHQQQKAREKARKDAKVC